MSGAGDGICREKSAVSADEADKTLRRNNSTRVSNVPEVAVEKLGTEPGVLAPSPVLTAPRHYARHTDAAV